MRSGIDLATALNEQAGFSVPLVSPVDSQNSDNIGQNYVDYLGLGQQRTLTLVNGPRFPAGVSPTSVGGLSVNLNMIPENLVERVETIAIGGAPIYGSDAIAGTINIILRDDFEGFELFGAAGTSPEFTDGNRTRLGTTWGSNFDSDRGNITLSTQYAKAGSVIFQDGGDRLSLSDFTQLYNDVERYNVTGFVKYALTDSITENAEGWFSRTQATEVVNQPFFNSSAFGGLPADGYGNVNSGSIPVLIDNPFLTDATCNTIGAALHRGTARNSGVRLHGKTRRPDWPVEASCDRVGDLVAR